MEQIENRSPGVNEANWPCPGCGAGDKPFACCCASRRGAETLPPGVDPAHLEHGEAQVVDLADGDPRKDGIGNLRAPTYSQNARNAKESQPFGVQRRDLPAAAKPCRR